MLDFALLCAGLKDRNAPLREALNGVVREIYGVLCAPSVQTADLLQGWAREFQLIYGTAEPELTGQGKWNAEALLAGYGIAMERAEPTGDVVRRLTFSIQTCFSLLMKLAAREALEQALPRPEGEGWEDVVLGRFAQRRGVENYCEADWYCWPVFELSRGFGRVLDQISEAVAPYRVPMTAEALAADYDCDHLKGLYEALIPRRLRHALGEYYTPGWLAERVLRNAVELHGGAGVSLRLLDPTCGSGTFLFQGIRWKRRMGCGLSAILDTVAGLDINPLAVLTAKTTYLLAVVDLLRDGERVRLPVHNADILRFPERDGGEVEAISIAAHPARAVHAAIARDRARAAELGPADLVVGNPPWVNWEYMPEACRENSRHLWADYGLFSAKGRERSFSKEDISALITYLVADKLLKDGGTLAFVLRQAMFKSQQNGVGFRRFSLGEGGGLKVLRVEDLSAFRVFEHVSAAAALLYLRKGEETVYPVPYWVWERQEKGAHTRTKGKTAFQGMAAREEQAMPSAPGDRTSIWVTGGREALEAMGHVLGENGYQARTGVFTGGANGVYWLRVTGEEKGLLRVANVTERAKRSVREVTALLEPDYLYPMLRGGGVDRWRTHGDLCLLCPHTSQTKMRPVPGAELAQAVPYTYAYLSGFRRELDARKGFAGWEKEIQRAEFHAVLRVGEYTFAPYKVVWRYIATEFVCAVVGERELPLLGRKLCLPNEKVMYIGTDSAEEAYYLCGLLSSAPVARCVKSYMNPTCISTHVIDKLKLPPFDPRNVWHREIARLCRAGHQAEDITPWAERVDRAAAKLYGLSRGQLEAMKEDGRRGR